MTVPRERSTVGLVLVRPSQLLGSEPFYQELIAGAEGVFGPRGITLLLQVVTSAADEAATYLRWAEDETVAGVLVVDLDPHDSRVELLVSLGLPAVVVGDPATAGSLPAVWTDDASAMNHAVGSLVELGHSVIAHVSGPQGLAHSQIRIAALHEAAAASAVAVLEASGDYSEEAGLLATRELLSARTPPTAIVYDDDLMAIGGLRAARESGLSVPGDLSIVAWDDSALCQLSEPALTVMGHDVQAIGELTASALLDVLAGRAAEQYEAPTATFLARESVGRPSRR
ncbi:LacI family transcriptional regulator [Frondihabitans sucicola]|uniref:LacI family transcriptional regulator n=1 Tax=Frondihabitans sucicola TaxID=1268041 RepID=A0ABN6XUV2_9MICO|nr:substrate-binding domain-containing protein [Frondihabitans sucicola]BDZ48733.1 LacI family transcriptional regulator [Frondihabitans sucicola]